MTKVNDLTGVELQVGTVDNQVVLCIQYANPDMSPVMLGLKDSDVATLIESLQTAQQQIKEHVDG